MANRVPVALIRQVCYPAGYRLPKLTRLEYTWSPPSVPRIVHSVQITRRGPGEEAPKKGNLPNDEYRFFFGRIDEKWTGSYCRWCGEFLNGSEARKDHRQEGCTTRLIDLYRKLGTTKICQACGSHTHRETWGVPLCSVICDNDWRFALPAPFKRALVLEHDVVNESGLNL